MPLVHVAEGHCQEIETAIQWLLAENMNGGWQRFHRTTKKGNGETSMSTRPKVVFVDAPPTMADSMEIEQSYWDDLDVELVVADPPCRTEADILAVAHDADVVIFTGQYTPFNEKVFAGLAKCIYVQRYGIGMDSVDPEAATRHNIIVGNAANFCVLEVADHTAALIYGISRQIGICDRLLHDGAWGEVHSRMLPIRRMNKQILGLIGFGRIGQQVALRMRPVMGKVIAYDPFANEEVAATLDVELWDLESLLETSDYISVHTPLMPSTRHLVSHAQIIKMKRTAYLINTSRGGVLKEDDLIWALQEGRIAGAALDVFDEEPLVPDNPLRKMDNVLLTPHIAGRSLHSAREVRHAVGHTVATVLRGHWPPHVFNADVTPRKDLAPAPEWDPPI